MMVTTTRRTRAQAQLQTQDHNSDYGSPSKKQKLSAHATDSRDFHIYPTPDSSRTMQQLAAEASVHGSVSSSDENEAPPGLLESVNAALHPQQLETEENTAPSSSGGQHRNEDDDAYHAENSDEEQDELDSEGLASEPIDGYDSDNESMADVDLSALGSFAQDVEHFRARHIRNKRVGDIFEGLPHDDDVTIKLPPAHLRTALTLIKQRAWSGISGDWEKESRNFKTPRTTLGRALFPFLEKLERLCMTTHIAPSIKEQNKFLNDHSDLLSYYISKIELVVKHIQTQRLAKTVPDQSQLNNDPEKRKKITQELSETLIPKLFRVLASAWCLGGLDWHQTSFTYYTTRLLMKVVCWIERLYRLLLDEEQKLQNEDEKKSEDDKTLPKLWHTYHEKRRKLDEILKNLKQVVSAAPDALEEEKVQRKLEFEARQRSLKRQEEIKAQQKRDKEARLRSVKEQKRRFLMSIRGISVPRVASPVSSSAQESPAPPDASSSQDVSDWSLEEKEVLLKKIQDSYPNMPDLTTLRYEFARTLEDTEAMAEKLLGMMLKAALPKESAAGRAARIRQIMQAYRRTYRR
ncbi:hypothetical protein F4779DRAFT_380733 [Xylariaceae sp. FL0662B]|nr:hypothetical protein F4779DRAFT_380733 [Xylariaceae sp. FL0662B]